VSSGITEAAFALGLGSNVGDRLANLRRGIGCVEKHARHVRVSAIYETRPTDFEPQPDFLNACCVGYTRLTPRELLSALQEAEAAAGRVRGPDRYGPRDLDLDILLYENLVMDTAELTVPHPRLRERAFVLVPLSELAPDWIVPARAPGELPLRVAELAAAAAGTSGVERTDLEP
jgi:2-amino-4-hydroxy-6-hydroxymethyldihydropteridine diphosphokinase